MGAPFPPESNSSQLGFGADLGSAARALVSQPSVPLVSLAAGLLPSLSILSTSKHHSGVLSFINGLLDVVLFFQLGWYGAERVFFQRHFTGKPVTVRHLLRLVRPFMGRFFAAGLPFGIVLSAFCVFIFSVHRPVKGLPLPGWFYLGAGLLGVAMDFALTFVTPALAYTTRSAVRALGLGFGMIRQTWPRCTLYVLCPPLALNLMHMVYPVSNVPVNLVISSVLVFVSLLAKGAIAAFYLRERGTHSEDGAAYITAQDEPHGSVALTTPIYHGPSA